MIAPGRLPLHIKIFHGFGAIAYGVKDQGFSVFLLTFYNQVLGLDAGWVGAAIMIALFTDAFADLIIGELGDRTQSRWGRRLPWLYSASIPLGLAWIGLWNPPEMSDNLLLLWLFVFAILVRTFISACEVPSVALVPEMTSDYHERTRLLRFRFLFAWGGGLAISVIAYGLIFKGQDALTQRAAYPTYALLCAILMSGSVLLSALALHKYIARPSPPRAEKPEQAAGLLRQMFGSLSNRPFLILISAALFFLIGHAASLSMVNYVMVFIWRLDQTGLTYYGLSLFIAVLVAFLLVSPMSQYFGKKRAAMIAVAISASVFAALYAAWLLRIFPGAPHEPNMWVMFALMNIVNSFAIIAMILNNSMMADVVEASQAETGRRSEGLFFAGYFFMQKSATGIGIFLSGIIISGIGFPAQAKGGAVALPILDNLALWIIGMIVLLCAAYIFLLRRFPIGKEEHDQRLAAMRG